jgi:DNA-binding response OmpR family regulator
MSSVRQILSAVWDYSFDHVGARVDSYVSYLRNKIDSHGDPSFIQTAHGAGYRFDPCAGE